MFLQLLQKQSEFEIGHIGLGDVLQGKLRILPALESLITDNKRIIVIDAVTNEEINSIAESMAAIENCIVFPVDPGPLSAAFGRVKARQNVYESKYIVTVGSVTGLTGRQLRYLIDKTNASPVYVNPERLATMTNAWNEEVERATANALDKLVDQEILIVTTHSPTSNILPLSQLAQKENVTGEMLAKRITTGLAKVTHNVIRKSTVTINGTFSSGGDVTAALFSVIQAELFNWMMWYIPLADMENSSVVHSMASLL